MKSCIDGKQHGAIVTGSDDPEVYDPTVFTNLGFTPPNPYQWGYCGDCRQPFRWSVLHQRWITWPGGLAPLPLLTAEELEVLEEALFVRAANYQGVLAISAAPGMQAAMAHQAGIVQSFLTAVREAQHGLWEPEDRPAAPLELWAWVGEDEFGTGEVGLKQADVPAGRIPLVSILRSKIDATYIRAQLTAQAQAFGKAIRLARFREVPYDDPVELTGG